MDDGVDLLEYDVKEGEDEDENEIQEGGEEDEDDEAGDMDADADEDGSEEMEGIIEPTTMKGKKGNGGIGRKGSLGGTVGKRPSVGRSASSGGTVTPRARRGE